MILIDPVGYFIYGMCVMFYSIFSKEALIEKGCVM